MSKPRSFWLIVLAALVAFAGVCVFLFFPCFIAVVPGLAIPDGDEIAKTTYQFLLVTVLGGAVAALYSWFKDKQNKKVEQKKKISILQGSVVESYNAVKLCRRRLRWATNLSKKIPTTIFNDIMLELENQQLKFEQFKRMMEVKIEYIPRSDTRRKLEHLFEKMEKYLNNICKEWEDHTHVNMSHITTIRKYSYLNHFISSSTTWPNIPMIANPDAQFFCHLTALNKNFIEIQKDDRIGWFRILKTIFKRR